MLEYFRYIFGLTQFRDVLWTIEVQEQTIIKQRAHIRALDERIAKLEREADGLRQLL